MPDAFPALALLLTVVATAIAGVRLTGRGLAVGDGPLPVLPYTSGHLPTQHALSRYHARWYAGSVVFLAFDVEMLFMYPWAVVVADLGPGAVVEMFGFLTLVLLAVLWARREGALSWA
ncbi:NADH-quinone oxidoreductase subunit A [Nocardioidaceae bacterium]|nr:NADH-quinone oxidoreductase subunit A [Nocardioidaceae bacterium]